MSPADAASRLRQAAPARLPRRTASAPTVPVPAVTLLAVACLVAGCAAGAAEWRGTPLDPARVDFAPALDVDLSEFEETPSGLYLQDLEEGEGAAAFRGSLVYINYAGWLPDGTLVDTSVGGPPFQFRLGGSEVIRGWNEGIQGMQVGGRRRLVVRPGLGYGGRGSARVPPDATLVFEVELVEVR